MIDLTFKEEGEGGGGGGGSTLLPCNLKREVKIWLKGNFICSKLIWKCNDMKLFNPTLQGWKVILDLGILTAVGVCFIRSFPKLNISR